ncbi:MAG: superinfection immunity protein [Bacteroidota bacterium]|nr:superinfection immunity protein [Bacteroidota bacterium]
MTYINTIGGINNFMWRILILSLIYFIPSIIGRRNRDRKAIFLVNLFLGWTGIGWIATFIWAVFKK